MSEKVKVQLVMRWDCPRCQHINYHTGKILDEDTAEAIADDDEDPSEFMMAPDLLFCGKCESRFEPDKEED